jgi:hypothetical protein
MLWWPPRRRARTISIDAGGRVALASRRASRRIRCVAPKLVFHIHVIIVKWLWATHFEGGLIEAQERGRRPPPSPLLRQRSFFYASFDPRQ